MNKKMMLLVGTTLLYPATAFLLGALVYISPSLRRAYERVVGDHPRWFFFSTFQLVALVSLFVTVVTVYDNSTFADPTPKWLVAYLVGLPFAIVPSVTAMLPEVRR